MKNSPFVYIFLGITLLSGTVIIFRDKLFGVDKPVPYREEIRITPPEILYYRDARTNICFSEISTYQGLVLTAVPCTPEVMVLVKPWPTYYR